MGRLGEFIVNHWVLVSALVFIIVLLISFELKRKVLGFKDVKPIEAIKLMNQEGGLVLDVREDEEYRKAHILNAKHIPLGLLEGRMQELESHKDQPLILCCQTGQRAAHAGVALRKQGFTKLYKLAGGMVEWRSANLPVEKGR